MNATFIELVAVGLAAGAMGALLGVGGGLIIVPALTLLVGLSLRAAVGTSLVCVCATSVAASHIYLRRGRVDLPAAVELQLLNVIGAVAAGLAAAFIAQKPLYFAFATVLVVMGVHMWPRTADAAAVPQTSGRRGVAQLTCMVSGFVSGLLGIGGGVINTPVLHSVLGLPFDRAVASSAYMVGITAAAGALVYLIRADVDPNAAAGTMIGVLAGSFAAASFSHRVPQRLLKRAFVVLLMYVAIQMVRRGLSIS